MSVCRHELGGAIPTLPPLLHRRTSPLSALSALNALMLFVGRQEGHFWAGLSLSLQSSAVEQVLDILIDILSWEIAEVVSLCLPRGLWSHIVIRVFLLLGNVCPRHPPCPVLPSCPLSRAFPYPQPGDAGGRRSAPAVCQSFTSADPTTRHWAHWCCWLGGRKDIFELRFGFSTPQYLKGVYAIN